jgi:hypothetical protein
MTFLRGMLQRNATRKLQRVRRKQMQLFIFNAICDTQRCTLEDVSKSICNTYEYVGEREASATVAYLDILNFLLR